MDLGAELFAIHACNVLRYCSETLAVENESRVKL